jgi:hypothetical protein
MRWRAVVVVVAALGCHAGLDKNASGPGRSGGFAITERAETGPIVALAVRPPFLWAAGAPGLRRWNLPTGEYEDAGSADDPGTAGITAIALDDDGGAWVAGPHELGRWAETAGELRYQAKGTAGKVTALAARRPVRTEGVWVGGPEGLARFDEGRGFVTVDGLRDAAVTSLTLDDDGRAVWVGTRAHGLYRADGERAAPVTGGDAIVLDEVIGVAKAAAGTRVVAGNVGGEARLYALTMAGAEGYRGTAGHPVVALVDRGGEALLVAGPSGAEQTYTLRPLAPGALAPPGSLHFSSLTKERSSRWAAVPLPLRVPPAVTVAAAAGDDLYVGTARMGVARAAAAAPAPLPGSELVGDAEHLFVACVAPTRCFVVTDGPHAWQTDGDHYRPARVGEPVGGAVLALASDARGAVYAISAESHPPGLAITKHAGAGAGAASGADGGDAWQPVQRVPLELPPRSTAKATFAALSPAGALWVGLRATSGGGGEDVGHGAIEIDLANGRAVEHRPYRANEHASPEALPLPANLTGIAFAGRATWYASIGGIARWQEGQLRTWSENEGLGSELVHAIGRGGDNALWAATSAGLVRWDGKDWRALGPGGLAARGLATDTRGRVWVATNKGLRVIELTTTPPPPGEAPAASDSTGAPAGESGGEPGGGESAAPVGGAASERPAAAPAAIDLGAAPVVLAGDMRDVVVDRYGRVWALSSSSIALVVER